MAIMALTRDTRETNPDHNLCRPGKVPEGSAGARLGGMYRMAETPPSNGAGYTHDVSTKPAIMLPLRTLWDDHAKW